MLKRVQNTSVPLAETFPMKRFGIYPSGYPYVFTSRQRCVHILPFFNSWLRLGFLHSRAWVGVSILPCLPNLSLEVRLVFQPFVALSVPSCFYSWLPLNSCNPSFPTGPPILSAFLMPSFVYEFVLLNSTQLSSSAAGRKFVVQWRGPRDTFTCSCDGLWLRVTDGWLSSHTCWMNEWMAVMLAQWWVKWLMGLAGRTSERKCWSWVLKDELRLVRRTGLLGWGNCGISQHGSFTDISHCFGGSVFLLCYQIMKSLKKMGAAIILQRTIEAYIYWTLTVYQILY